MGLPLERFDLMPEETAKDEGPSADYFLGFAEGLATAKAEHELEFDALKSNVIAALSDLGFGYIEARKHILDSLTPLLSQIAMSVVPTLLRDGLGIELSRYLQELAQNEAACPIEVTVNRVNAEFLTPLLPNSTALPIRILVDDTLPAGEARWSTPEGETALDMATISSGIQEAIAAIVDQTEKGSSHG